MSTTKKNTKTLLSSAAAALFISAPLTVSAEAAKLGTVGQCWGINSCKGTGACKSANNACAGKNSCKLSGFIELTEAKCNELGGDFAQVDEEEEASS